MKCLLVSGRRGLSPAVWSHQNPQQGQHCTSGSSRERPFLEGPAPREENYFLTLFRVGLLCKIPEDHRTEVPSRNSKVTSYSSELHRILKLTSRAAFRYPRAGWAGQCWAVPTAPSPGQCPALARENHPELQSFKKELFQHLSDFTPPTKQSLCAHKDQQDLGFLYFLFTSHLLLQYYSWPGTTESPWWCLTQRLKSVKHTIETPIEFNWDMLQSSANEAYRYTEFKL